MAEDRWDFDKWARSYDEEVIKAARAGNWIYKDYDRVLDTVVRYCNLDNNTYNQVLDIGVGTGNLAARFLRKGFPVMGIDPSEEMRIVCEEKYPDIMVLEGDFLRIPLYIEHVDLIVSAYAFHHLTPAQKADSVLEVKRVLKPKGTIVIADLMFRNAAEEQRIKEALRETGKYDILEELEGEYPGYFEELTRIFNGEGFNVQGERLTESVWILCAWL